MSSAALALSTASKKMLWTGRILSGLVVLFLGFDSVGKLLLLDPVVKGTAELGFSIKLIVPIGVVLMLCVLLYAVPRTSVLGAILLTGYLGGAVVTQLRVGNPLFGFVLAPVYVGILAWVGLYCRDERVRSLLPFTSQAE